MGRIEIIAAGNRPVIVPLAADTVIGTWPGATWSLRPPLLPDVVSTISAVWVGLRWDAQARSWRHRAYGAVEHHSSRTGAFLKSERPLAQGDRLAGDGVELRLVDASAPDVHAVRLTSGVVVEGDALHSLVELLADGWFSTDGEGPLDEGGVFVADRAAYRLHLGVPPLQTEERRIDLGRAGWLGTVDILAPSGPTMTLSQRGMRVAVCHEGVRLLAAYALRRRDEPMAGWMPNGPALIRYHQLGGTWTRAADMPKLRSMFRQALSRAGVSNAHLLYDQGPPAGPNTVRRVAVGPDILDVS